MSEVKKINLILLFLVLAFGIEENYCSDNVGGNENFDGQHNENFDGQHVGQNAVQKKTISWSLSFFLCFIFPNFAYWFFDRYQKKRGWYFYKYYYCGGYRTRLYHKIFYFDIYLRFFILRLVCPVISFFVVLLRNKSCLDFTDERVYVSAFLCIFPEIDLNIRLGEKFYLVIGFKDIFAMPLYSKFIQLAF